MLHHDVITIVAMFTIVAIDHNCRNINHSCRKKHNCRNANHHCCNPAQPQLSQRHSQMSQFFSKFYTFFFNINFV